MNYKSEGFQNDPLAKKVARFVLIFELFALLFGLLFAFTELNIIAQSLTFVSSLLILGALVWSYNRFQKHPSFLEKNNLNQKALDLKAQIGLTQDSILKTKQRRENLQFDFQKEKARILAEVQNQYIIHGMSSASLINSNIPGVNRALKSHLAFHGVISAADIKPGVTILEELEISQKQALLDWRNGLSAVLELSKPINITPLQNEQIRMKYISIYKKILEDERKYNDSLASLQKQLQTLQPRLQEYSQVTFSHYLRNILSVKGIIGGSIAPFLIIAFIGLGVSTIMGIISALIPAITISPGLPFKPILPGTSVITETSTLGESPIINDNPLATSSPINSFFPTNSPSNSPSNWPSLPTSTQIIGPGLTNTLVSTPTNPGTPGKTNTPQATNTSVVTILPGLTNTSTATNTPSLTPIPTGTPTATFVPTSGNMNLQAFPGAEGFGAGSVGGRGGKVYEVTNTNDSGVGSLRGCVEATGPRICVFRTGGLISLNSPLSITNPFITIAGQTAPGGGITIKLGSSNEAFLTKTHDVIIRYISVRPGPGGENHGNQIAANGTELYNIMIDHNTYSWGVDSNIETWYRVNNTTIQWSIISEPLDCSTHSKGCHSKGIMIGGYKGAEGSTSKGSENISILHNLIAHYGERGPLVQACGIVQIVNNISYNPLYTFAHQQLNCPNYTSYVNWIGNYHKLGPDSTSTSDLKVIPADDGTMSAGKVYVQGNIGPSRNSTSQPESDWVNSGSRSFIVSAPAIAPIVTTTDAITAYNSVLASAGNNAGLNCDGTWFARRDAIDTRIVNEVMNGSGQIIDDPSQVGGWITPALGTPCVDSDHDGMPDVWEQVHGLNPNDGTDGNRYSTSVYTNLEVYLNSNR